MREWKVQLDLELIWPLTSIRDKSWESNWQDKCPNPLCAHSVQVLAETISQWQIPLSNCNLLLFLLPSNVEADNFHKAVHEQ